MQACVLGGERAKKLPAQIANEPASHGTRKATVVVVVVAAAAAAAAAARQTVRQPAKQDDLWKLELPLL